MIYTCTTPIYFRICNDFLPLENDAGPVPLPNDKALKDKKRKLKETLDRMVGLLVSKVIGFIIFIVEVYHQNSSSYLKFVK